ncbi:hypothetical protein L228DRAFT_94312 [Xylona heveae TC161]|uniref:Uncharacterized protein n=1 Tax=Xylona heveae (strain CBS 132557 / TC161) TaxID=1328760 RepID=A0A165I3C6_XYLHT|nr:hypothetical protein L228DRAFT_94312 [Xylona heveae TC161]KZF24318.1 hypothetical protein L228DRAFT_94312 [Xylona heveae TC161]
MHTRAPKTKYRSVAVYRDLQQGYIPATFSNIRETDGCHVFPSLHITLSPHRVGTSRQEKGRKGKDRLLNDSFLEISIPPPAHAHTTDIHPHIELIRRWQTSYKDRQNLKKKSCLCFGDMFSFQPIPSSFSNRNRLISPSNFSTVCGNGGIQVRGMAPQHCQGRLFITITYHTHTQPIDLYTVQRQNEKKASCLCETCHHMSRNTLDATGRTRKSQKEK